MNEAPAGSHKRRPSLADPGGVARLGRQGQPVGTFVYGRRYRELPDAVELDPVQLRLLQGPFETARLGGFFRALRDALPDHWGCRVIARHGGLGEPSDVDLLLLGPDDRCGAVGFGRGVDPPAPQRRLHHTLDLERIKQAADAILREDPLRAGSALEPVEALIGQASTSMGGARPKTTVEADNALWLAKFPAPSDTWNQPRVQHGLLLLARRCGLQVAESRLTTDRGRWSYLLLADELRRVSAQPAVDLRELFGRICFNAAVSNIDDHPRNHALLARSPPLSRRSWRITPMMKSLAAPRPCPSCSPSLAKPLAEGTGRQG
jgi:serine/threonine-protein kinase HipA